MARSSAPAQTGRWSEESAVRVLLVDDHPVVAEAVTYRLTRQTEHAFDVVAHAVDGAQALALYRSSSPDVVLCDIQLKRGMTGVEFTARLLRSHPEAKVVMYSAHSDPATVQRALDAGACGFISKQADPAHLAESLLEAVEGNTVFDPSTASAVIAALRTKDGASAAPEPVSMLSPRELDILQLMCSGTSANREIARELSISEHSVKTHMERIFVKLNVKDRTAAVVTAFREGIVEPPSK